MSVDVIMGEEHEFRPPLNSLRQEFLPPLKRRREFRPLDSRRHESRPVKKGSHDFAPPYSSKEFLFRFIAAKLYNQNESSFSFCDQGGASLGREMEQFSLLAYHIVAITILSKILKQLNLLTCEPPKTLYDNLRRHGKRIGKIAYMDEYGVYFEPDDDDDDVDSDFEDFVIMDDDDVVMDDDDDDDVVMDDDDDDDDVVMDEDEDDNDNDNDDDNNEGDDNADADDTLDMDLLLPYYAFPLVEVFSVVVNINKNITSQGGVSSLYGRIIAHDSLRTDCIIYRKEREDSKSKSKSKSISLSGAGGENTTSSLLQIDPSRPILACDTLDIMVDLKSKDTILSYPDKGALFCRGRIRWHFMSGSTVKFKESTMTSENSYRSYSMFNKPLYTKFKAWSGSVEVKYVIWNRAVGADVEVTLIDRDGADVYGLIKATSRRCNLWSVLFQEEKSDESIDVGPGKLIPLSRSLVTVHCYSTLTVAIKLYDRRRSQDGDGEIANDTVDFDPQNSGREEKNIPGRDGGGGVQVKVTWRAC